MINALFVSVKRNILQIAKHFQKAQKASNRRSLTEGA